MDLYYYIKIGGELNDSILVSGEETVLMRILEMITMAEVERYIANFKLKVEVALAVLRAHARAIRSAFMGIAQQLSICESF